MYKAKSKLFFQACFLLLAIFYLIFDLSVSYPAIALLLGIPKLGHLSLVVYNDRILRTNTIVLLNKRGLMRTDALSTAPLNIMLEANMRVQSDDKNFYRIIYRLFGPYACFQKQRHLRVDQIQTGDNVVKRLGDRLGVDPCVWCSLAESGPLFTRNCISNNIRFG